MKQLLSPVTLEKWRQHFEQSWFIENDPISIPHAFDDPRDQEIIGLYAALLAWGKRAIILKKMEDLCQRMDYKPSTFVLNFDEQRDGYRLATFKHRTFQPEDALWLTKLLSEVLKKYQSIENFFGQFIAPNDTHVGNAIQGFSTQLMTLLPHVPHRLQKHVARPETGSACKRLNMYLRWMVRSGPVDLGIWHCITPAQLLLPLDVHVGRQARKLGFLKRKQNDWKSVLELTETCKQFYPNDPACCDYVFFGLGVNNLNPYE